MNRVTKYVLPVFLAMGTLMVIAVVMFFAQVSTPEVVNAQNATPTPPRTDIGVSGTGHVFVQPDTAIASVGVDITAPTLAEATQQASDKMTAVINAIKAQGVDAKDIQTSSYNVYPITNQPKEGETPKITGYHVTNIVTVKVRTIANVGKVLDAAITAGANSINSVYFTVNDPSKPQDEARALAVKEAMAKAQTLASAAGVKVGKIITISELSGGVQPLYKTADYAAAPAAVGAGPVETGQNEITATVEMHFEIAQ
ncbi:MAG: SIMPL domain-containing protein [Chloroflexi bacterium]|nr:SIMPL domain-containing protein [Chloroflexota bacterium]